MVLTPLPIDPLLPDAVNALRNSTALVLEAEPGAGKTTRIPWALLESGIAGSGEVVVLQPRRLAVRLAARRIAEERGEKLGERIGYQVRFEEVASPRTKLRLVTEGVLTRRLVADPQLRGIGCVVLDEFHERHLQGDLALALLRRLQRSSRPDLKLVLMSATLDASPLINFLDGCPHLRAPGRRFEVAIEHQPLPETRPLEVQVQSAVRRLVQEGLDGSVLVFLPGAAEIRRAREACEAVARSADLEVLPLHGDLSPEEQDRAVRKGERRKVILSTNVAESSVTIDGVVAVIDSGLARIASHSPWSGLPTLKTGRVSKASAIQRAGRAGRTGPGRCLRLYTRHDFDSRPDHESPEVNRLDMAETALALHGLGVDDLFGFGWFESPPRISLEASEKLLGRLDAIDKSGALTQIGKAMLEFPLHPRQARVLLEARSRGVGDDGAALAALLGEGEIRSEARGDLFGDRGGARASHKSGSSDLLESLEAFREAQRADFEPGRLRSLGLEVGSTRAVDRVRKQLVRIRAELPRKPNVDANANANADPDRPLLISVLTGYPDRVARRRDTKGSNELLLAGGGAASLDERSVVRDSTWMIAVDAEERAASGRPPPPGASRAPVRVRVASAIEPDWLLDLFGEQVTASTELEWNASLERVEGMSRMLYDGLVIEETRESKLDPERASAVLAQAAKERGVAAFVEPEALATLVNRVRFLAESAPELGVQAFTDAEIDETMRELCIGRTRFSELREADLLGLLMARRGEQLAQLDAWAPVTLRLPGGRQVKIHYEIGQPPWAESFLQDFFGMAEGPKLARGRVPLVLHLLAPNRRAVQVSTDLAGFWERHYPSLRKELGRRYPRHSWPDDPRHATPPAPRPPRGPRR
jgi:ATP-dependent helicase HrpB